MHSSAMLVAPAGKVERAHPGVPALVSIFLLLLLQDSVVPSCFLEASQFTLSHTFLIAKHSSVSMIVLFWKNVDTCMHSRHSNHKILHCVMSWHGSNDTIAWVKANSEGLRSNRERTDQAHYNSISSVFVAFTDRQLQARKILDI